MCLIFYKCNQAILDYSKLSISATVLEYCSSIRPPANSLDLIAVAHRHHNNRKVMLVVGFAIKSRLFLYTYIKQDNLVANKCLQSLIVGLNIIKVLYVK